MHNVLQILRRDFKRLVTVPAAWVIMIGLILIPPLYAWFNIYGFWNPYGNTDSIKVAVANMDKGTDNALLGKVNLGDQIEGTLKSNDQLGWEFMGKANAMEAVESGDCYAAIVIPSDFSEDLANVVTNSKHRPTLEYYVNEKASPISPKITDQGATVVDRTVNNTFVSTVSGVLVKAVNSANGTISGNTNAIANETIGELDNTKRNVGTIRSAIADLDTQLANVPQQTKAARNALNDVQLAAASAGRGLAGASTAIGTAQTQLNTLSSNANSALETGSGLVSQATAQSTASINQISSAVSAASGSAQQAVTGMQNITDSNAKLLEKLKSASDNAQYQQIISKLENTNNTAAGTLADLKTLSENTQATAGSVSKLSTDFNIGTQNSLKSAGMARNAINSGALPRLNSALGSLAGTAGTLAGTVTSQDSVVRQTNIVLDQLDQVASDARIGLEQTDQQLAKMETKLTTVSTDLKALGTADLLASLTGSGSLDADKIASFMESPTVIDTKNVYPVNSYGSGMAPLMTNLALWVGAFAFVVIYKVEVDDEGLEGLDPTATEKYLARYLLLGTMGVIQGAICTVGDLILGVQTACAPLFILTGMITSLVYLSITYALSTTFMHIGKGLCVALVIVQIPGASGLYPIEMMPKFFRMVYPFVPFSYSIDAFRETIAGFYDGHWTKAIGTLLLFAGMAFVIGLVVRPLLVNLNRLFAREIKESDMIIGEEVELPERGYNMSQAIQVLADKGGYREVIEERASRFAELYPKLKRGALVIGFVVPVTLAAVFSFTNGEKVVVLATWVVWILLIMGFLMVIEYMRDNLNRQVELGHLSDESIQSMLVERQAARIRRKKRAQQERRNRLLRKTRRRTSGKRTTSDNRNTSVIKETTENVTGVNHNEDDGIAILVQKMQKMQTTGPSAAANDAATDTAETAETAETTETTENNENNEERSNA